MTNMPYEERIKNRDNDWYYNKCIRQYHFIIKSEGANQRYKEEIKQLTKAKETTENEYGDLLKAFAKSEKENKKEIARLNKIIDELEKCINKEKNRLIDIAESKGILIDNSLSERIDHKVGTLEYVLDKLQELKEGGKNNAKKEEN